MKSMINQLARACAVSSTTLEMQSRLPTLATASFLCLIDDEQILCTNVTDTTWTVVRGQNGTVAAYHTYGSQVSEIGVLRTPQDERILQQSHESCKYQLLPSRIAGFSAAVTSAADWDGAVAGATWTADVAAHVRLLNQSTGVSYTLTTATTCTATGETALNGAEMVVTGSAGRPTYSDTAATGAATPVFVACPPLGDAIVVQRIPPSYSSATPLALSTDASTSFPAITFPTLTASRNYSLVVSGYVTLTVDSDTTGQAICHFNASITVVTDASGVSTCTVDPPAAVNNTDNVPTALLGVTCDVAASTGGITVKATRKSGIAMHASYELTTHYFRDVGAASEILLPTDTPGLLWWHKSGVLITTSGSDLVTWGDSSGNSCTGTVVTDATKSVAQYSATGGAGLAGARVILAAGNPNALWLPAHYLDSETAIQMFSIFKRVADPSTGGTGGTGGIYRIGAETNSSVPWTDGVIYDCMGSSVRKTVGSSGGAMSSVCCYTSLSTATEWTARLNGAQLYTTGTNTVAFDASPRLWVAGDDPHTLFFVGEWYEDFAFDHKLTPTELAAVSAYVLTGKQGQGGFGVAA